MISVLPADLSKVYALAEWITILVEDHAQDLLALRDSASTLWKSASPSSGHALCNMWAELLQEPWPQHILGLKTRLESVPSPVAPSTDYESSKTYRESWPIYHENTDMELSS